MAWLERVQGLLYYSTTDWNPSPWDQPWLNDGNGDAFLFYPPRDGSLAFDACNAHSNRLVPSIRWELLREGMEDYEYLWLLNGADPQIGVTNEADTLAGQFIASRTLFSRVPTDLYQTRAAIAAQLTGPKAAKSTDKVAVAVGETFNYLLVYDAGDTVHTVLISDSVPTATMVITAAGNKGPAPIVTGQAVSWTAPVASQEIITLTITARGITPTQVTNTAVFSNPQQRLNAEAEILVYNDQVYLPLVLK